MEKLFFTDLTTGTTFDVLETQSQRHSLVVPIVYTELLSNGPDIKNRAEALTNFISIGAIRFNGNCFRIGCGSSNDTTIQRQRCIAFNERLCKSSLRKVKDDKLSWLKDILRRGKCTEINKRISEITLIHRMAHSFFQLNFDSDHGLQTCEHNQVICFKWLHVLGLD